MRKKKECIYLIVGFLGAVMGLFGVVTFNQFVLMSLPLGLRMISMIFVYWLIALIVVKDMNTYGNLFMNFFIVYLQLVLLKNLYFEDLFIKK